MSSTLNRSRAALAGLSLAMLLASLGTSVVNVALPTLASSFGVSFAAVQWVVLAYLLSIASFIVAAGRLGDVVGRRRLLVTGLALFTTSSMVCAATPVFWLLVLARGMQGVGAALMMALSMAMVGETVSREKLGGAMGLLGAMSAVGTALGPTLAGLLIAGVGWRAIFVANAFLGAMALFITCLFVGRDKGTVDRTRLQVDPIGMVLFAVSVAAYALAMTTAKGGLSAQSMGLMGFAAMGVLVFIRVERRVAYPMFPMEVARQPRLIAGLFLSACVSTVMMSTLVVGPFYLAGALRLSPAMVGGVSSIGPIVVALGGMPAGRLADRFGASGMTVAGLAVMMAGAIGLASTPMAWGIPGYIVPMIVITMGYGVFQTANNTAVLRDIDPRRRGVVSGLLNLSRNLGLITGASAMGGVFAVMSGASELSTARPHEIAAGLRATFAVATILLGLGLAVALRGRLAAPSATVLAEEAK